MTEPTENAASNVLIDEVADWLMTAALRSTGVEALFAGCCQRLAGAGIPVLRGHIAFRTLHPLLASVSLNWYRESGLDREGHTHGEDRTNESWRVSPLRYMLESGTLMLRRRLTGPEAVLDFPILEKIRDKGGTDYLAWAASFTEREEETDAAGMIASWTSDRPGGFTDNDIRSLLRIQKRLAVAVKLHVGEEISRNVMSTYLGADAGLRVLSGQIRRGDGEVVRAVIWYSDMRDSTGLADRLPMAGFLALLNSYFECAAGALLDAGGEVLLLIGDAVLGIFPVGEDDPSAAGAAARAVAAARDAEARIARFNDDRRAAGEPEIDFGLGLHLGDLMFGNIGVPERLQFTAVGPAVNEVARIESLTKRLGRRVLLGPGVAGALDGEGEALGEWEMPGVGAPLEVFGLAEPPANADGQSPPDERSKSPIAQAQ